MIILLKLLNKSFVLFFQRVNYFVHCLKCRLRVAYKTSHWWLNLHKIFVVSLNNDLKKFITFYDNLQPGKNLLCIAEPWQGLQRIRVRLPRWHRHFLRARKQILSQQSRQRLRWSDFSGQSQSSMQIPDQSTFPEIFLLFDTKSHRIFKSKDLDYKGQKLNTLWDLKGLVLVQF